MKKIYNLLTLFLLLFIGQSAWGAARITTTTVGSGSLSGTIDWKVVTRKVGTRITTSLSITGSGEIPDFSSMKDVPWASISGVSSSGRTTFIDYRSNIKSISISDGITKIGKYVFNNNPT